MSRSAICGFPGVRMPERFGSPRKNPFQGPIFRIVRVFTLAAPKIYGSRGENSRRRLRISREFGSPGGCGL